MSARALDRATVNAEESGSGDDASVNAWLLRAPWWKVSVVMGVLLAPFIVVTFRLVSDMSWAAAVTAGLVAAAVCGPMVGYMSSKQAEDSTSAAGPLPEYDRARVERAARRGPVPPEDELREAALRIVEYRLFMLRMSRGSALGMTVVLLVGAVFLAVVHSPWWWLGLVVGLALLALVMLTPGHLERRARLLRHPPGSGSDKADS